MPRGGGGHGGGGHRGGGGHYNSGGGHHGGPHFGGHGPRGNWHGHWHPFGFLWGPPPPPIIGEPPPPAWLCCFLCCWAPPRPPPPRYVPAPMYVESEPMPSTFVVNTTKSPLAPLPSSASSPAPREVACEEYRVGVDQPEKFMIRVPDDAVTGNLLRVRLAGLEYTVRLPDGIQRGENVVVIAPTPNGTNSALQKNTAPAIAVAILTPTTAPAAPSGQREINALELRNDDTQARYSYTVPADTPRGQIHPVRLAGREFSVKIPDYVRTGETVTIIAPAAVI